MRLSLLDLGRIREIDSPIEGYLIRLDDGTNVLVDTGCTREMIGDDDSPFQITPGQHVGAQLAAIGLEPSDIDQVICTHLDPDHCGGHEELPDAEFIVQRRHLAEARGCTRTLVGLATAEGVRLIVHSHDREQWPTLRHSPAYDD